MSSQGGAEPARNMFGHYEIIDVIGRGGMGVVYRAHDHALDRIVALKVLRDDLRRQPKLVTRFQREAQATAQLDHPNIVQILAVGSEGGLPYIAMDYIDGTPLNKILLKERFIEQHRALNIAEQLADALACAHDAQIIHRDVKPANVILETNGHAYLTDFGLAKILTEQTQLTVDGSRLGTPQYMAPERCRSGDVTAASDIYALGIVLFQMISGRLPFEAPTPVELVKKILATPPARLRHFMHEAPEDVERLVAWTIEREARHRPATAHVLREAIARVKAGMSLDEEGSNLTHALAGFRDSMATPTPEPSTPLSSTQRQRPWWTRLQEHWKAMARGTRAILAAGIGLLAIVCLVSVFMVRYFESPLSGIATQGRHDTLRWRQSGVVADFEMEAPGVFMARIDLPGFGVTALGWLGADAQAVVGLDGHDETPRAGQGALCLLDLVARKAQIRIPPVTGPAAAAPTLYLLAVAPSVPLNAPLSNRFLLQHTYAPTGSSDAAGRGPVLAYPLELGGGAPTAIFDPGLLLTDSPHGDDASSRVAAAAIKPDGHTVALALSGDDAGDVWYLLEREPRWDGVPRLDKPLTHPGLPITAIQYSPDGSMLAYLRDRGPRLRELWLIGFTDLGHHGTRLAEGDLSLQPSAFSPDSEWLVIHKKHNRQNGVLRLIQVKGGAAIVDLGPGSMAAWHPSAQFLVATSPDRKGHHQLWAIERAAPHRRVQLTHLTTGISPRCAVSGDGAWAMTSEARAYLPTVVLVDLSDIRF